MPVICKRIIFLLLVGLAAIGRAPASDLDPKTTLLQLAENVYTVGSVSSHEEHPVSGDTHFVVTQEGVVVIDTGGTPEFGRQLLKVIQAQTRQPIRTIIYTHWHWDHVLGASALAGPGVEIIANANVPKNFSQHWGIAATQARLGVFGYSPRKFADYPLIKPTRTYKDTLRFKIGGEEFVLYATQGETDDQTFVHLPGKGLLFVGDHFNPMLGHPLTPEGDLNGFVAGLQLIEKLAPKRVVHGHGEFGLMTPDLKTLPKIRNVALSIMQQVQILANEGRDLEQTQQAVILPPDLASDAFARVVFKFTREPFVNRLHGQMTGYYGASAVTYAPAPRKQMAQIWHQMAGGQEPLVQAARKLLEQNEPQAALEVLEPVLLLAPDNPAARGLQADAFEALAKEIGLGNFYRYYSYLAAAQQARTRIAPGAAAIERRDAAQP